VAVSTSGPVRTTARQTGTYTITKPFLAPFVGLFGTAHCGARLFEVNPLVAILVYALIAWVLVKAVGLVLGDTPRGVRATSSQIDTRVR